MARPAAGNTVKYNLLLFTVIVVLFFLNFYSETLFYRPSSVHQWRQTDCLSITKNYYEEGMHFFSPKVHTLRAPQGKAVSEMPILNYTVAFLWKLFGEHEFIYRLLDYFIYLCAIFILFNTLLKFFNARWLAVFLVSILLTSPLLTYYSFNFLSDVPALSFCIMSFCFVLRFYKTKALWYFYLALVLATLAILLKASALVAMACLVFLSIVDLLNLNRLFRMEKLFKHKIPPVLAIVASMFLVKSWYQFAALYNSYNNGVFLLTILPIWDMDQSLIFETLRGLFNDQLPAFLNRPMLTLFSLMALFVCFYFRQLDVFLRYCVVFSGLFFILYILFFFRVFIAHDYYLINLFIFPVILFFSVADILGKMEINTSIYVRTCVILVFVFNCFYAASFYRLRMIKDDRLCAWFPFISNTESQRADYEKWIYNNNFRLLEDLRPDLRRLGLKREDAIVCVEDDSPNISLYFMDQKGYTITRGMLDNDSLSIKRLMVKHFKYLVVTRPELKNEKAFRQVEPELESIFKKSHIEVFKVKS